MPHKLLVYGDIVQDEHREMMKMFYGDDHEMITPRMVSDFLENAKGDDVEIRLNTPGGHSNAGFAIQSLFSQYQGNVTFFVDGMAASAGTMILMAKGDGIRRKIAKNAALMAHKNSRLVFDRLNADDARQLVKEFDSYDDRLVSSYADVTGLTKEQWLDRIKDDYYINAAEAKDLKLVDEIVGESDVAIDYNPETFDRDKAPEFVKPRLRSLEAAKLARQQIEEAKKRELNAIQADIESLELTLLQ